MAAQTAVIASPGILTAATLNGAAVTVSLDKTTFASGVGASSFELVTSPAVAGLTVGSVSGGASGSTSATLNLSWGGTTLAADAKLKVRVLAAAHVGDANLETAEIDVLAAADTAPSFPVSGLPNRYFLPVGVAIEPFQVPAASGGNGAISYIVPARKPPILRQRPRSAAVRHYQLEIRLYMQAFGSATYNSRQNRFQDFRHRKPIVRDGTE